MRDCFEYLFYNVENKSKYEIFEIIEDEMPRTDDVD